MFAYLLRRLLLAIPTLLLISMITFGLSKCAPYDPVRAMLGDNLYAGYDPIAMGEAYKSKAQEMQLDVPDFYFTLTTAIFPDSLDYIYPPERRERLHALTARTADWPAVSRYETAFSNLAKSVERIPSSEPEKSFLRGYVHDLLFEAEPANISNILSQAEKHNSGPAKNAISAAFDTLKVRTEALQNPKSTLRRWMPVFYWHGAKNQYHRWLSGFITGNLGRSVQGRPVWDELRPRLFTTLTINGLSILFSFLFAIPLGMALARRRNRLFDRLGSGSLLFMYALPVFWVGSLLMLLFATRNTGLYWIHSLYTDVWNSQSMSYLHYLAINASKFILPILTLSLHLIAILALQMRSSILEVMNEDFIRTARAKGLSENQVYWKHAFRNALFPMITLFAGIFPALFTGSLVVEYLFQFPGIGMKSQEAFITRDYPVLFAILMLASALTVFGNLIADWMYAWADPRVRYTAK